MKPTSPKIQIAKKPKTGTDAKRRGKPIAFDDGDVQTLIKLGLNNSQAKIYLTLVSLEAANAKKIAQTARIYSGEVYRQIEALQKKGIVEKILHSPNEYKPMPLNEAVRMLIQDKKKEQHEIQQEAKALLKKRCHPEALKDGEHRISIVPKNDYYRNLLSTKEVTNAQKEIIWYTQLERIPIAIINYNEAVKNACTMGEVRWRVIAELNKPTEEAIKCIDNYRKGNPSFEIKFSDSIFGVNFEIYDDKEMNFSTERMTEFANSQILTTNNEYLIKVIKDYFEFRWNTAMTEIPKKGKAK